MVGVVLGPHGEPVRRPGLTGDWVDLAGAIERTAHVVPPDPLEQVVADLVRRFDPGGYVLSCPLEGCGWELLVPRMELDPEPLDVDTVDRSYVVYVEGVPREDLEQRLGEHIDAHATSCETVDR